jgi:hypothetical protein
LAKSFLVLFNPFLSKIINIRRFFVTMATQTGARKIKVDASAEGCSGMYWRTEPKMSSTSNDPNWPRNGQVHVGEWIDSSGERWVKFSNNFWLPEKQKGFTILFDEGPA